MNIENKYGHWEKVIRDLITERDHAVALCDSGNVWRKSASDRLSRLAELASAVEAVIEASKDPRIISGPLFDRIADLRDVLMRVYPPNSLDT
jgi:hypothetical protein